MTRGSQEPSPYVSHEISGSVFSNSLFMRILWNIRTTNDWNQPCLCICLLSNPTLLLQIRLCLGLELGNNQTIKQKPFTTVFWLWKWGLTFILWIWLLWLSIRDSGCNSRCIWKWPMGSFKNIEAWDLLNQRQISFVWAALPHSTIT